ncbi:acyl-CoA dehydrogenase family protein [Micromonospora sp. BRA006-A]|nr:acyl-CoA dehydrogenase family protein [Micromonospora sp. BRA006-A]
MDLRTPGVTVRPLRQITGRADFAEISFDGARVPADAVLGEPGDGFRVAMTTLAHERGTSGFNLTARLEEHLRQFVALLRSSRLADDPGVRDRLATVWTDLAALRWTNLRLLAELAEGGEPGPRTSVVKLLWSQANQRLAHLGAEVAAADERATALRAGPPAAQPGQHHRGRHQRGAARRPRRTGARPAPITLNPWRDRALRVHPGTTRPRRDRPPVPGRAAALRRRRCPRDRPGPARGRLEDARHARLARRRPRRGRAGRARRGVRLRAAPRALADHRRAGRPGAAGRRSAAGRPGGAGVGGGPAGRARLDDAHLPGCRAVPDRDAVRHGRRNASSTAWPPPRRWWSPEGPTAPACTSPTSRRPVASRCRHRGTPPAPSAGWTSPARRRRIWAGRPPGTGRHPAAGAGAVRLRGGGNRPPGPRDRRRPRPRPGAVRPPIGANQAVSHPLAQAYARIETARSLAYRAAWCVAGGPGAEPEVVAAALAARAAALTATEAAIQTLGAAGFTWAHPAHRWYRRALWHQDFAGTASDLRAELAAMVLAAA